jgi:hypothetical protein
LVPAATSLPFAGLELLSVLRAEERVPAIVAETGFGVNWDELR